MDKFCGYCGAPLEPGAKRCGQCGMPVEGVSKEAFSNDSMATVRKMELQKKLKAILAIVIAAIIAIIAIAVIVTHTGYNNVIRQTVKAYKSYNIDRVSDLASGVYDDNDYYDVDDYFRNTIGTTIDQFESILGQKYSLSYKVNDVYDVSNRKDEEIRENIGYMDTDFDDDSISKIKIAEVTLTAKHDRSETSQHITITMTRENGKWKILYLDSSY